MSKGKSYAELKAENKVLQKTVLRLQDFARKGLKQYNTLYAAYKKYEMTSKDLEKANKRIAELEKIVNAVEQNADYD